MDKLVNFNKDDRISAFGIDLGTTNSAIAVVGNDGVSKCLELNNGKVTMPSCVLWDANNDKFIVGDEAYNQRYKSNACYSVKRLMGSDEIVTFEHAGKVITKTPEEVSAIILQGLIDKVKLDYLVKDVVITVPAGFNISQIEATKRAAEIAGLNVLNIMREPTAASLVYRLDKEPGNILVYDLGGGTFDVSIVNVEKSSSGESNVLDLVGLEDSDEYNKDSITVLDTKGNNKLGGDDLDLEIYKVVESRLKSKFNIKSSEIKKEDKEKLILRLEEYKITPNVQSVQLQIDMTLKTGRRIIGFIDYTLDDLRNATIKIYKRTKSYIDSVLTSSRVKIDSIVLVGGSTKNRLLQELLINDYPNAAVCNYLNPDEAVALGAAIQAKRLKFGSDDLEVFDVTSNAIGVLSDGRVNKLIDKNQSIPCTINKVFTTSSDDQEFVDIKVYEGGSQYKEECEYLGDLVIKDIPKGKAGEVLLVVSMTIDSSGLLQVSTTIGGKTKSVTLVNILGKAVNDSNNKNEILFRRWESLADSIKSDNKEKLLNLIEKAKSDESKKVDVAKLISELKKSGEI